MRPLPSLRQEGHSPPRDRDRPVALATPRRSRLAAAGAGRLGDLLGHLRRPRARAGIIPAWQWSAPASSARCFRWPARRRGGASSSVAAFRSRWPQAISPARCRDGPGCCRSRCSPSSTRCALGAMRRSFRRRQARCAVLAQGVPLPTGAAVLDAGCGLGAGLAELHREYPRARLEGIEWSWPLWLAGALRCRFAHVRRGDLWSADWSRFDARLSLPAARKACRGGRQGARTSSRPAPGSPASSSKPRR